METVFIIHDHLRYDRETFLKQELANQKIESFEIIPAVKHFSTPETNICEAHKNCIRIAKERKLDRAIIFEDDISFTDFGAFESFIIIANSYRNDYNILSAGSYWYKISLVQPVQHNEIKQIKRLYGTHCYIVNSNVFDEFLTLPTRLNIDVEISSRINKVFLCLPMFALQHTTKSDNTGRTIDFNKQFSKNLFLWKKLRL